MRTRDDRGRCRTRIQQYFPWARGFLHVPCSSACAFRTLPQTRVPPQTPSQIMDDVRNNALTLYGMFDGSRPPSCQDRFRAESVPTLELLYRSSPECRNVSHCVCHRSIHDFHKSPTHPQAMFQCSSREFTPSTDLDIPPHEWSCSVTFLCHADGSTRRPLGAQSPYMTPRIPSGTKE